MKKVLCLLLLMITSLCQAQNGIIYHDVISPTAPMVAYSKFKIQVLVQVEEGNEPRVLFNDRIVPFDYDKQKAVIDLSADWKGKPDEKGIVTQSYNIKIYGNHKTKKYVQYEGQYFVQKPPIIIDKPRIYMGCGNLLLIKCPTLGNVYNPSIRFHGGSYRRGRRKGDIIIIPKADSCKMIVSSGGDVLDSVMIKADPAPKALLMMDNQEFYNLSSLPDSLKIRATSSDSLFPITHPKDARYKVYELKISIIRNGEVIFGEIQPNTEYANFTKAKEKAKRGDVIQVEPLFVRRKNFLNQTSKADFIETKFNLFIK